MAQRGGTRLGAVLLLALCVFVYSRRPPPADPRAACPGLMPAPDVVRGVRAELLVAMRVALAGIRKAVLVKLPMQANKGDSAIGAGELEVLRLLGINLVHAGIEEVDDDVEAAKINSVLSNDSSSAVLYHGGGNLGDVWPRPNRMRTNLMWRLNGARRSVLLPQTIHYTSPESVKDAAVLFDSFSDLTLMGRDAPSFSFLQNNFAARHRIVLSPDSAFALGPLDRTHFAAVPELDFLYFIRTDKEAVIGPNMTTRPEDLHPGRKVEVSDWLKFGEDEAKLVTDPAAAVRKRTALGLQYLARAKVVVTDRLHGHILCLLLDLPHVLLDNSYAKVMRYHSMFTLRADNVRTAGSVEEAAKMAEDMLKRDYAAERKKYEGSGGAFGLQSHAGPPPVDDSTPRQKAAMSAPMPSWSTCSVCLHDILPSAEPVFLAGGDGNAVCQHLFCRACAVPVKAGKRPAERECPTCRAAWEDARPLETSPVMWMLYRTHVLACPWGCGGHVAVQELEAHAAACPKRRCGLCAAYLGLPTTVEEHVAASCPEAVVECVNAGCGVTMRRKELEKHAATCPKRILTCEMPFCGFKVGRAGGSPDQMREHDEDAVKQHLSAALRKIVDMDKAFTSSASKVFNLEKALAASDHELQDLRKSNETLKARLKAGSMVVRIPIGYKGSLSPDPFPTLPDQLAGLGSCETGTNEVRYLSPTVRSGGAAWNLLVEHPRDPAAAQGAGVFLQLQPGGDRRRVLAKWGIGPLSAHAPVKVLPCCQFAPDGGYLGFPGFGARAGIMDPAAGYREEHGKFAFLAFRVWVHVRDALPKKDGGAVPQTRILEGEPDWYAPF
ncbi:polysaccharide pyruvyl transferase-domain-containing protein [Hyaloraphidium curvatum]|nr:polysaccharide pyruvyl transferase-domain-containing protein [Hyaloraphidium curvatum]